MGRVVVTGAASPLGRRVLDLLAEDPAVDDVHAIDAAPAPGVVATDLDTVEPKRLLDGAEALVHLGFTVGPLLDGAGAAEVDVAGTRRLLEGAAAAGIRRVVVLSSAMVYGARADNPVPLTEADPLRPNAELEFAVGKAELERLAREWRDEHPAASVAVLRPVVALSESSGAWLAASAWSGAGVQAGDDEPPVQFLHLDDLAAAIDLARVRGLDGVFNVAPDGWLPPDAVRELVGPTPRVRLSVRTAERLSALVFRAGLSPTPPGTLAYARFPWVVANDRLRTAGWMPRHSNEETFVAGSQTNPLTSMSAKRRQEISLVLSAVVLLGGGVAAVAGLRRLRRRR